MSMNDYAYTPATMPAMTPAEHAEFNRWLSEQPSLVNSAEEAALLAGAFRDGMRKAYAELQCEL